MNEDIEERLQVLRPAEMPPGLLERLGQSEPPAVRKIRWLRFLTPLAAAAAVAVLAAPLMRARKAGEWKASTAKDGTGAVVTKEEPAAHPYQAAGIGRTPTSAAAPSQPSDFRVFVPIEQTSTLLDVRDVTVIDAEPSQPVRYVRTTWLDDITYAGDDGSSRMRRRVPRTEIVPVPIDSF